MEVILIIAAVMFILTFIVSYYNGTHGGDF